LEIRSSELSIGSSFIFSSFDKNGNLYSNKQTLYFPVYCGDTIAAILSMSKYNNEICISIGKDFASGLDKVLASKNQVALFDDRHTLYAITNSNESIMLATESSIKPTSTITENTYSQIMPEDNIVTRERKAERIQVMPVTLKAVPTSKYLSNYQIVGQNINLKQYGICWAASIASMVRFEKPSIYGTITAKDVCDAIGHSYSGATWTDVMNAMNYYFTSPYLPTQLNYVLSSASIRTVINNNDPALMGNILVGGSGAHHTALCGYISGYSSFSIRLMDPAYECFKVSTQSSSGFTFPFGNDTYKWDKTVRLYYS